MKTDSSPSSASRPVRLVIADDHYLVRSGVRHMLASEPDLQVVGEAVNGQEALELCRKLRPDLLLMDVHMPVMDGLKATRAIKEEGLATSVLIVTTHENPEYLFQALKAGAAGYLLKDAPKQQLISAIRRVANGESPLNQELAARLIQRLAAEDEPEAPPEPQDPHKAALESLTNRELDVLRLLAQGQSNPQIADSLVISRGTVKGHVQHIISKLGVSDRTQAAVRAIGLGLINPAQDGPRPRR
jgi:DNA-binding NarL/FixJ family response regulator